MGILKRVSGFLLRQNSVPYNRLIKGHTVTVDTDFADKAYTDLQRNNNIASLMARMGVVIIPTNIALTSFPNPITVNGQNYTLVNRQRVLLTNQTTSSENGVYEVSGVNLIRVNDYLTADGIIFTSINTIGLRRWTNVANALNFNGSGEAQVRVKNTGTDIFGGFGVDPATGELFITNSALPGASGSLTIENSIGTVLGVASKQRFSDDFTLIWDAPNSRITIAIDPDRRAYVQSGNYIIDFSSANELTRSDGFAQAFTSDAVFSNGTETDLSLKCLNFGQVSQNPNFAAGGVAGYQGPISFWANNTFNLFFKCRSLVTTLINSHVTTFCGYMNSTVGNDPTNAIYFKARPGQNSGNWQCVCTRGGVSTTVNTAIAAQSTVYRVFEVTVLLGVARFYIDNVLVATISTNLPNTSSNTVGPFLGLFKTSTATNTASDVVKFDYATYYYSIN